MMLPEEQELNRHESEQTELEEQVSAHNVRALAVPPIIVSFSES